MSDEVIVIDEAPSDRQIVAVMIDGVITTDPQAAMIALHRIVNQQAEGIDLIDRWRLKFMAACDLGPQWTALANAQTLFALDEQRRPVFIKGGRIKPKATS